MRILYGVLAGLATIAAFIFVERFRGERAMMPLSLFASKAFAGLSFLTFTSLRALGGLLVLLPYTLIASGYSPLEAGLAVLPFPLVIGLASRWIGQFAAGTGPRIAADARPDRRRCGLFTVSLGRPRRGLFPRRVSRNHRDRGRNVGRGRPVDDRRLVRG